MARALNQEASQPFNIDCDLVDRKPEELSFRDPEQPFSALEHISNVAFTPTPSRTSSSSSSNDEDHECAKAQERFENQYPQWSKTKDMFKHLRKTEFSQIDKEHLSYFDYTGGALAPRSLIEKHLEFLRGNLLGNPHSAHGPSLRASNEDEAARQAVLNFCNADPSVYTVIWTANASAALKVVGSSYPFSKKGAFVYAPDCHNSVLGISEFAKSKGAAVKGFKFGKNWTISYDYEDLEDVMDSLTKRPMGCMPSLFSGKKSNKLLAVPAQSNVSGLKHCTKRIVDAAHQRGWDVLLDMAALAPTSGVNLSIVQPEFVCVSFYKIFGYPTGIGCLVAKKSALARLQRPWFAGGTIRAVLSQPEFLHHQSYDPSMHQCWEDGTINFQQTSAVRMGLEWIQRVGVNNIRVHTSSLIQWIAAELKELRWDNGAPFCFIPEAESGDQGSSVSMLVLSRNGKIVPHKVMEAKTAAANFAVRTGCFCNPGTGFLMLNWADQNLAHENKVDGNKTVHNFIHDFHAFGEEYGAKGLVRVSVGIPTTFADAFQLLHWIQTEILAKPQEFEAEIKSFFGTFEAPYSFC
eukprot:3940734-Rhodomonas_salina.1